MRQSIECGPYGWIIKRCEPRFYANGNRAVPDTVTWAGPFLTQGHAHEWLLNDGPMKPVSEGTAMVYPPPPTNSSNRKGS